MNLYEFVTNILNSSGKSNNCAHNRAHELSYTSKYEDTLLMLFMAAQRLGYCGLTCYYSKGSLDIDTVRIFKLGFTKKLNHYSAKFKRNRLSRIT